MIAIEKKRKWENAYYLLRNINLDAVKRGLTILTESAEEKVRLNEDKQIIRLEEDLCQKTC